MMDANRSSFKLSMIALTLAMPAAFGAQTWGQEAPAISIGDKQITGIPEDWSLHHVVYSNPGTEANAIRKGKGDEWLRIVNDPRYILQQLQRHHAAQGPAAGDVAFRTTLASGNAATQGARISPAKQAKTKMAKDWSMSLAGSTTTGKMGAGQYPAKYSFSTGTASCNDFVVYPTGLGGTSSQATIVAYNNLYQTTCASSPPSVYWSYNTGGTALLSPILSLDGTQVAYVQTIGTAASLVLLKWVANTGTEVNAPYGSLNSVTNAAYRTCTTPCYTTIALSGSANDTNSAPFFNYFGSQSDMYVGDNSGKVHHFTGVFSGTPAESTAAGWPVTLTSGNTTTGAVYEPNSTLLFVGDSGGYLYSVTTTGVSSQTVIKSAHLAATGSTGIVDAPLIDSMPTTPKVYAFVGDDSSGDAAVEQFPTSFAAGASGTIEIVSSGSGSGTSTILYDGAFDNLHYDITGGTAGNLYVCGFHSSGDQNRLYQIVMNSTFTGAVNSPGTDPSGSTSVCSPVTEFLGSKANTTLSAAITTTSATSVSLASGTGTANGDYIQIDSEIMHITTGGGTTSLTVTRGQLGTAAATHLISAAVQDIQDWIYLSVTAGGTGGGTGTCTTACLYNYSVTTGTVPSAATDNLLATGGTSAIIIDNSSTATGESQIYYSTLGAATCAGNGTSGSTGTHGCAVQASQSAP